MKNDINEKQQKLSGTDESWRRKGDAPYYRKAVCVVDVITGTDSAGPFVHRRVFHEHGPTQTIGGTPGLSLTLCKRCLQIVGWTDSQKEAKK